MAETLPETQKAAAQLLLARMYAYNEQWSEVQEYCNRLTNSGLYSFSNPKYIFNQKENHEIIWGGFRAARPIVGSYLHPLLYREVLILNAISAYRSGNMQMAIEPISVLKDAFGEEPVTQVDNSVILDTCEKTLPGTGVLYPYYRMLEGTISNVSNFTAPKNYLLPIPQTAMNSNPNLQQNVGY